MTPDFPAAHRITLPERTTFSGPREWASRSRCTRPAVAPPVPRLPFRWGLPRRSGGSTFVIAGPRNRATDGAKKASVPFSTEASRLRNDQVAQENQATAAPSPPRSAER
jgi:hypothetical protein